MLRLGEFEASKYKVLILPRAEAIGEQEAEVIRKFAEGGGTVIADVRPGIYDGHCKPREGGVLDDLFGIQRKSTAAALTADVPNSPFDKAKIDGGVAVSTGKAMRDLGGAPALIVNNVGKGRAVLINTNMDGFGAACREPQPAGVRDWAVQALSDAGVQPQVVLEGATGQPLTGVSAVRWQDGDMQLLSLFREAGAREEAVVKLPQAMHVYNLRSGQALGKVSSFRTEIIPCRATFLALCPTEPREARISLDSETASRGEVRTVSVQVPGASGLKAYRVRARCGEMELDWLEQNVLCGEQPAQFVIPVAYNDPTGDWTIEAKELFTGRVTTAKLTVE